MEVFVTMSKVYPREFQMQFDRRVPMRDGITLSADIYMPVSDTETVAPRPVILVRTPYMKSVAHLENVKHFIRQGYIYVMMDVRGRGDSDGEFIPYFNEGRDGYDAIEWCANQPWCDGNVGTLGASYCGRIQWLAALEQPPHLRAMVVLVTPSDPFVETPTGTPGPMHLSWFHLVSGRSLQAVDGVPWDYVYEHLPLVDMDTRTGRSMPIWHTQFEHTTLDDYWQPLSYQTRFSELSVPVLHISGWYDDEQIGTPLNFTGMTTQAATKEARQQQRLLMGPWGHASNHLSKLGEVDFGSQAIIDMNGEQTRWFDRYLKHKDVDTGAPVRLFVMGENVWRDEQEWPLARTQWTPYYLHSAGRANSRFGDGRLSTEAPVATESFDSYQYDPKHAVPFITDSTSAQIGGPDDYAAIERRDDVLVYMTEPLERAIEVTGPIAVDLYASSSAPDTDFMAMLIDVWPNGFCQRLCDGMVRARFRDGMQRSRLLEPDKIYRYRIDCWNTAQLFSPGHRICVQITSSAFPKYDRNQNIADALGMTKKMAVAEQRIYHDVAHPSSILLPIIPRLDPQ